MATEWVDLAKQFLTTYGPLGLGWLLSGVLLWKFFKIMEERRQDDLARAEVLTSIAAAVQSLENSIGTHQATIVELQALTIRLSAKIEQMRR